MPVFRIAKKIIGGLKALNHEAKFPGQPPPHKASENPFHKQPTPRVAPPSQPPPAPADDDGETPWYLDGQSETDGWENTNAVEDD
jgi:hypothetical protein